MATNTPLLDAKESQDLIDHMIRNLNGRSLLEVYRTLRTLPQKKLALLVFRYGDKSPMPQNPSRYPLEDVADVPYKSKKKSKKRAKPKPKIAPKALVEGTYKHKAFLTIQRSQGGMTSPELKLAMGVDSKRASNLMYELYKGGFVRREEIKDNELNDAKYNYRAVP